MPEDKGYHWGLIAPWDASNYSNPGQFAGMQARQEADANFAKGFLSTPPAAIGGLPGGPASGAGYGSGDSFSLSPKARRTLLWIVALIFAIFMLVGVAIAIVDWINDAARARARSAHATLLAEAEAALASALAAHGDRNSAASIGAFVTQSPCHRATAGGHFANRTTALHCRGAHAPIDGHIGFSHFSVDAEEVVSAGGADMAVSSEISVYPFNAHNLASTRPGISALDADDRALFAGGVARVREARLEAYLKRPDCAIVRIEVRASRGFGTGWRDTAHAYRELPLRLGCMAGDGFRYVL